MRTTHKADWFAKHGRSVEGNGTPTPGSWPFGHIRIPNNVQVGHDVVSKSRRFHALALRIPSLVNAECTQLSDRSSARHCQRHRAITKWLRSHCLLTNGLQSRAFLLLKPTTTPCPLIYRSRRLTRCTRQRTLHCRCRHSREHVAYCFTVNVQVAAGGLAQGRWFGFGGRTWPCIGSAIAGRGLWAS